MDAVQAKVDAQNAIQSGNDIETRMKQNEAEWSKIIDKDKAFIIRLDGKKFSPFTSKLLKNRNEKSTYDKNFCDSMVKTMNNLVEEYNCATGYTHSDEITLIFPKCLENQTHIFSGKQQKLVSILASYCSTRFYINFKNAINNKKNEYNQEFLNYLDDEFVPVFDARLLVFSELNEIVDHMYWRSVLDCYRNCIQSYSYKNLSKNEYDNKSLKEMLSSLISRNIIKSVDDIPFYYKHGVYAKKILFTKNNVNPLFLKYKENSSKFKTVPDEYIDVTRTKIINKCFKIKQSQDYVNMLLNKYWTDDTNNFIEYKFQEAIL